VHVLITYGALVFDLIALKQIFYCFSMEKKTCHIKEKETER